MSRDVNINRWLGDGPTTRAEWLENNRSIMEQEGETAEAIFRNQIGTRLRLAIELRNEDDERLGDAYVACLSQYEYESDAKALSQPWKPLDWVTLVLDYHIHHTEAKVIVAMAKEEYEK